MYWHGFLYSGNYCNVVFHAFLHSSFLVAHKSAQNAQQRTGDCCTQKASCLSVAHWSGLVSDNDGTLALYLPRPFQKSLSFYCSYAKISMEWTSHI